MELTSGVGQPHLLPSPAGVRALLPQIQGWVSGAFTLGLCWEPGGLDWGPGDVRCGWGIPRAGATLRAYRARLPEACSKAQGSGGSPKSAPALT